MLQPLVGLYTDKKPQPYSLMVGMGFTLVGLLMMSRADSYPMILLAAALIGMGSSVFHPEASRVARMASGGRYGLAQSLFQVGGNMGSAAGPLLAAFIVVPHGQHSIVWFSAAALVAMLVLFQVGGWYGRRRAEQKPAARKAAATAAAPALSRRRVTVAVAILVALLFSKNVYSASLGSYFTLYLMSRFGIDVATAQLYLFAFLVGIVGGTIAGGAVGDKVGRIPVMWFSILGALPFALMLPYANLFWTGVLAVTGGHDHGLGLLGHPGLRPGADAGPRRPGGRHVLRLLLRSGRAGRGRPRRAGRLDQHRDGLQGHALPSVAGNLDGIPAAPAGRAQEHPLRGALTAST